jgi:zinc protease
MRFLPSLLIAFVFSFSHSVHAEVNIDPSQLDAQIPADPAIRKGTLPNGLTYYIRKNAKPEKRMELRLVIKAGAINEDADQNGVAHFVEHMLFNGTEHFPKNELVRYLEKIGVRFGADLNAYTSTDHTAYQLPIPTDKPELISNGFKILADWAGHASFDPKEIDKERGVILEEWRLRQGAGMRASKAHRHTIYYGSKLETHDVIGDKAVIEKAPYPAIKRFYQDWYRPDLMAVVAVGDFDVEQIEKQIKDNFSSLKNPVKSRQLTGDDIEIKANKEPLVSVYADSEQTSTTVNISYKKPAEKQGTFRAYQNSFIHNMESSILGERIDELLQKKNPPLQMAGINYGNFFRNTDTFGIFTIPKTEDFISGYKAALTEVFRGIQHGFTENEYNRAKANLLSGLETYYNNREKIESANLADEYIRNFIDDEALPSIEYEYKYNQKLAQTIGIEEINALLKNNVTTDNMFVTVTTVQKNGITIPTKEQLLQTYQELKNTEFAAYQDSFSAKSLFNKELTPGSITKTTEIKEIGLTEFVLSNGIKVLLKPTTFNDSEILFQAFSKGGSSLVPESDYLNGEYAAQIINSSGIADFNNTALQKILAGKYVGISPYIDDLSEGFNGATSPKDIETLMQLLHLYFTSPHKDKEAFDSFITRTKQWVDDSKRNPTTDFKETISYIMSGNDPRNKPITKEMIEGLNLDKAFTIYQQRFADASDFTFVFVGAMEMEKFKNFLTHYLASLPTHNSVENFKNVFHDTPKQAIKKTFYKGKEDKSNIVLKMNGDFEYNRKNIYLTQALVKVLNYRLIDKLREEKAEVYSPHGYISVYQYPKSEYVSGISLGSKPSNVANLIKTVKNIVHDLQTTLPSDEDMQKIKEADTRQYEINLKENNYWMNQIENYYYNNLDVRDIVHYPDLIKSLTKQDIKQAAIKYFNLESLKEFVLYPEPSVKSKTK